ncbi:MAG: PhoH family protein [Alphaproteobacteria bacterium]|nr:PhoH family protein [Alphaproteobacteria bacterium]
MTTSVDTLDVGDPRVLKEIAGELGAHLTWVADTLGVHVSHKGTVLRFASDDGRHHLAMRLFAELARLAEGGHHVHPTDVRDALRILTADPQADVVAFFRDAVLMDLRKRPIVARSPNQRSYLAALRAYDIVFGLGPAGTGKTYLAMASAVAALKRGQVRRIVLSRPAVEAGEKLGFLPGDLADKVDPYLRPLFDALGDMIERDELAHLFDNGTIEVAPLAFMRGRTLNDCYVVLDEAQNATVEQMRMFLTRLGDRGRMVITGDTSQTDLPHRQTSGLAHAVRILSGVPAVGVAQMTSEDVVRHPLVAAIIEAYEHDDRRKALRAEAPPGGTRS